MATKRSANYNTKQGEIILNYIISLQGSHVTAAQIHEYFAGKDIPIGRTTIYRHLEKLTESGRLRKYITDGLSGACYQHLDNREGCRFHLHLKCESCGVLQHVECGVLDEMQQHVSTDHDFSVNLMKTVIYGKCSNCQPKGNLKGN